MHLHRAVRLRLGNLGALLFLDLDRPGTQLILLLHLLHQKPSSYWTTRLPAGLLHVFWFVQSRFVRQRAYDFDSKTYFTTQYIPDFRTLIR